MRQILGGVQCLPNRFSASLTSATLHASLRGYEYAGGDRLAPARASKPCVPPLREARCQSFMKWRSSRICAPAPTREGRCSFAWWPQK